MTAFEWAVCHKCKSPITAESHFIQQGKGLVSYCFECWNKHIRRAGPIERTPRGERRYTAHVARSPK